MQKHTLQKCMQQSMHITVVRDNEIVSKTASYVQDQKEIVLDIIESVKCWLNFLIGLKNRGVNPKDSVNTKTA